ncbi:MAG TPA: cysteine-rich CWC family protein [Verrucomicrobiae bacterium]|nr:cysteine-rich CWC family protein [Verrucomicrobiae bacterium]
MLQQQPVEPAPEPVACQSNCPVCGAANQCRLAAGCLYKGPCWCESRNIPVPVLRQLASEQPEAACLCPRCLTAVSRQAALGGRPEEVLARARVEMLARAETAPSAQPLVADFYLDAKGLTVFTAEYHLRRGYCCQNGCRHCPYPERLST